MKIERWELQQNHENELRLALKESMCSFSHFDGTKFWPIANDMGHTSMDFEKCKCKEY